MGYTLNFNLIWRHFDKLWGGLLLSLELAVAAISIGIDRHRLRRDDLLRRHPVSVFRRLPG
jgi:hypothetical protein